jgi:hypothetical protein
MLATFSDAACFSHASLVRFFWVAGGLLGAAQPTGRACPTLSVDDTSDGFMGDTLLRCELSERLMSRSFLNLRPDILKEAAAVLEL